MSEPPPPSVSVLMTVYNGERHLPATLRSVLEQTYRDFELIVVDDASTDDSSAILAACDDPRLRVIRNDVNRRLTASLNIGLAACRAPLIARMDADDLCEPTRLAEQVEHLRRHPEIDLLATHTTEIDDEDRVIGMFEPPGDPAYIRWELTRGSIVYHPTWLMRRGAVEAVGGYDERFAIAQDYALLARLIESGGRVAILPRRLVRYRRGAGSLTQAQRPEMLEEGSRIRGEYNRWLLGEAVEPHRLERAVRFFTTDPLSEDDAAHLPATLSLIRRQARAAARGGSLAGRRAIRDAVLRQMRFRSDDARREGRLEIARRIARHALTHSGRCLLMRDLWRRGFCPTRPAQDPRGPS